MKYAVIGGTGWQGAGVATRIVHAGHMALIGSRDAERSRHVCERLPGTVDLPSDLFVPMENVEAATEGEIVFVTVPMNAHRAMLEQIREAVKGKLVIDVTAPVNPDNQLENLWPPEGSATQEAQAILGSNVDVVGALKNVSAPALMNYRKKSNCDVLVIGDDLSAKHRAMALLREMGLNSYGVGSGEVCRTVEGLTLMLIYLNFAYHLRQPGVKIAQIDPGLDFIPTEDMLPPK